MKYYTLEPEVAGGWGKNTVFERTPEKGTVVHKFNYEFDGWSEDQLLASSPCFIVSERMASEIERAQLTGIRFDELEVTKSEQFRDLYGDRLLPTFVWLRVEGKPARNDFGLGSDLRLVVSERALNVLQRVGIANAASIIPYESQ